MNSELTLEIDTTVWANKLAQLKVTTGQSMREVLDEEWPLLMGKIIAFTPPKTLAQGRAAVASDIQKTMRSFDPENIRTEGIREIVDRKDYAAYNIVSGRVKSGPMAHTTAAPFDPGFHLARRNSRGRVGSGDPVVMLGTDALMLRKYTKSVQDRVGWAKAGWLQALRLVGGVAPSFVSRHEPGNGSVIDDRTNPDRPSITAINRTPWAIRKDEGARIIQDAYYSRAVAIFAKVKTKLRLAIQNSGFRQAA